MEVEQYIEKLKKIVAREVNKGHYESALLAARTLASIYYDYNQIYSDATLEDSLLKIRDAVLVAKEYTPDKTCVFFYDGFGFDLRGWAVSYVRSITKLGYYLIYACPAKMKGKIPHILSEMNAQNSTVIYFDDSSAYVERANELDSIFKKYTPGTAFFYTTPSDVSAAIAFSNNPSTTRIQIDLTDHAFWIGVNAFDLILECREMGASLAHYHRGVELKNIIKIDCAPYINNEGCNESLPFDIHKYKYVFTGGSLYKTLGDQKLLYYKTVAHILDKFPDIKFLYAGSGDSSEIEKLKKQFPNRVYLIAERPDFFNIIKNCILYLNSYPMFGGLMMRYAALASKVPITLKHGNDSDRLLINQDKLGIEFDNYEDYIDEIDLLLSDTSYRGEKEKRLRGSVYDEELFTSELGKIVKEHKSSYEFGEIRELDTTEFRNEYKRRYKKRDLYKSIASKKNLWAVLDFPKEFVLGVFIKIKEKLQ